MPIKEDMERQGAFLFRWRSYAPLVLIPAVIVAMGSSEYLERTLGEAANTAWEIFSVGVSFVGLVMRALIVGHVPRDTSGRNTGGQLAQSLNTTGMYSICRNPLYLANYVILLGFLIFIQVWWLVVLGTAMFWVYYERIIFSEEAYLRQKFGQQFLAWAEKTSAFVPHFGHWKTPELPFSFKFVLRRELSTLLQIVVVTTILHISVDLVGERRFEFERGWVLFLTAGILTFIVLLIMKRRGQLNVPGR